MNRPPADREPDEIGLLRQAISYATAAVDAVTPEFLGRSTPCREWDLSILLWHANESLAALHEAASGGRVGAGPSGDDIRPPADPARVFRDRAPGLLGRCSGADPSRVIAIADACLTLSVVAGAGALEIAVHGWDISQACGHARPMPATLAIGLLRIAPPLVPETGRYPLFAEPVPAAPTASPGDRLAAYLGRTPGRG